MSDATTNPGNEKALGRQSEGLETRTTNRRKFNVKSTATEAQYDRIDKMLGIAPMNTFELRRAGIMAPAARIKEMNDKLGYQIPTVELRDIWDEWGFRHQRVAVYRMVKRPDRTEGQE